jgi:hypothetical protein
VRNPNKPICSSGKIKRIALRMLSALVIDRRGLSFLIIIQDMDENRTIKIGIKIRCLPKEIPIRSLVLRKL